MKGNNTVTFLSLVRDTVNTHGLHFAVRYYAKRLPQWELRFWLKLALEVQ